MIIMKPATACLPGMIAVSALAPVPSMDLSAMVQAGLNHGDRGSPPRSNNADTSAPTFPSPGIRLDASSRDDLHAARESLVADRTGTAQQSPEMAETRLPGGSNAPDQAKQPGDDPNVTKISEALHVLGRNNRAPAIQILNR
jgi:hypothetical protein